MPTITIRDEQGKELLSSDLSGEGLGKYIKAAASLRAVLPLAQCLLGAAGGRRRRTRAPPGARQGSAGRQEQRAVDQRRRGRGGRPASLGRHHLRRVGPAGAGHRAERHGLLVADARGPAQGGARRDEGQRRASASRPARRFATPTSIRSTSSAARSPWAAPSRRCCRRRCSRPMPTTSRGCRSARSRRSRARASSRSARRRP